MDMNLRGDQFSIVLGLEVKGAIAARGFTVKAVADAISIERSTLSRYLNGKRAMPAPVLVMIGQQISVSPVLIMQRALDRMPEGSVPAQVNLLSPDVVMPVSPSYRSELAGEVIRDTDPAAAPRRESRPR